MKINNIFKLIVAVAIAELAGVIGSIFTVPSIDGWYSNLIKPELAPPNWVFGPVWTTLFFLMGISAFLVWKKGLASREVKVALSVFFVQLILNILWSIIFFGWQSPGAAFMEIIFLWLAIIATIIVFAKVSKPAAWLILPYIIWVSFAGYLNFSIWRLNFSMGPEQVSCTMEAKICQDGSSVGRTGPDCEFSACPSGRSLADELRDCLPKSDAASHEKCLALLKQITNYNECVKAGFSISKSNPPQCAIPDGRTFTEEVWIATTDSKTGATFQYPKVLVTEYIHAVDWPPQVQVLSEPFACLEAGSEIARSGQTIKRMVDDRIYCLTKESEGAAGSVYTNYAYAFPLDDSKTVIFTFSLRAVQCANYDEPRKTACENERSSFDLDSMIDRMAESIMFK